MTEKVNILVVDDRPDGLMAVEAVLDLPAYNLLKASSGQEALSYLLQYEVAVILLDVQMPVMDGFETAQRIQQTEAWKHIPIIFLTAINKEVAHIYRGYECGAVDYLFKPFDAWVLKSKTAVFVEIFLKNKKIKEQAKLLQESELRERNRRIVELELESLRRYRNLADAIPHIVWKGKLDPDLDLDYFNQRWWEYTGFTAYQSKGKGWKFAIDSADRAGFLSKWSEAMRTQKPCEIECRIVRFDGASRWHLIRVTFETLKTGEVSSWIGTCTDIHDRKEAEEKLQKAWEELEQRVQERTVELSLANEALRVEMVERMKAQKGILEISEREQKRIGQDLHDSLAQDLTGISYKVKLLEQKMTGKFPDEEKVACEILELLKSAIGETKRLARGFYPIELEKNGLDAALLELTASKEKIFNIVCEYKWNPTVKIDNRTTENHLYRIVQESIHNAVRHGKAKRVKVSVDRGFEEQIVVSIQDDGAGMPAGPLPTQGMGFRIMEYRTEMIGASLNIERLKDGGVCVWVNVPLSAAAAAPENHSGDFHQIPMIEQNKKDTHHS